MYRSHLTPPRTVRVLLAALVAIAVALALGTAPALAKAPGVPGDQPLPGYTISNPPLAPLIGRRPADAGAAGRARARRVQHRGARRDWNGELVMWAHGYRGTRPGADRRPAGVRPAPAAARARATPGRRRPTPATATTSRTGVTTTRGLADVRRQAARPDAGADLHRRRLHGRPRHRPLAGAVPRFYDGALPMCGVLGDQELFDYFLDYNLVAQDLADRPAYPPPADYLTTDVPRDPGALGLAGLRPGRPGHHQRPGQAAARDHHRT